MSHEATSAKSPVVAFLLWFFLGQVGAHRFYFGKTGSACGMLGLFVASAVLLVVAVGALGFLALFVWWVIDAFKINGWIQANGSPVVGTVGTPSVAEAA